MPLGGIWRVLRVIMAGDDEFKGFGENLKIDFWKEMGNSIWIGNYMHIKLFEDENLVVGSLYEVLGMIKGRRACFRLCCSAFGGGVVSFECSCELLKYLCKETQQA